MEDQLLRLGYLSPLQEEPAPEVSTTTLSREDVPNARRLHESSSPAGTVEANSTPTTGCTTGGTLACRERLLYQALISPRFGQNYSAEEIELMLPVLLEEGRCIIVQPDSEVILSMAPPLQGPDAISDIEFSIYGTYSHRIEYRNGERIQPYLKGDRIPESMLGLWWTKEDAIRRMDWRGQVFEVNSCNGERWRPH